MKRDVSSSRIRSIDNLIRLYTIVISLTITNGLINLIGITKTSQITIEWVHLTHFISLIFTIVPFYHGASRYLDVVYVFKEREIANSGALMIDFVILFFEGLLFFALSTLLKNTFWFYNVLGALLLIDTIWVAWTGLISTEGGWPKYGRWAIINLITVFIYTISLYTNLWIISFTNIIPIMLMIFSVLRTILDYITTWSFYFPGDE